MKSKSVFLLCLLSGLAGGLLNRLLDRIEMSKAYAGSKYPVVQASAFNLMDEKGNLRAQIGFSLPDKEPGLWLMDAQGLAKVNLGMYADTSGFLVFNDKKGQAIQILRSFGETESPLHIFKSSGQDQMILGLNPATDKTPFQFFYDAKRSRVLQFGKYTGP